MGEVVTLQSKPKDDDRLIWACNCGATTHHHYADGSIACASCEAFATSVTGEWRLRLPPQPEAPKDLDPGSFKVIDLGDARAFLRRKLNEADEEMAAVVIAYKDGGVSTWTGKIETPDQRAWLSRKLAEALERIPK